MQNNRESNFELLRLFAMFFVILFHVMVYGSLISEPYNAFTIPSLIVCSGAVSAVYAFMALSSYFLLEAKNKPVLLRVFTIGAQVLFMYMLKSVVLFDWLKLAKDNFFVQEFFVKGAWWFIYAYFVILLFYPILNKVVFCVKNTHLKWICIVLGIAFIISGFMPRTSFVRDVLAFVFTYFVVGAIKRGDLITADIFHNNAKLIAIYAIGYISTIIICICTKAFDLFENNESANQVINFFLGRYCLLQFIMGISLFFIFKNIKMKQHKWINYLARTTFYMFLLHETIIAVFWDYGRLQTVDGRLPYVNYIEFIGWILLYLVCVIIVAFVVYWMYQLLFHRMIQRLVVFVCNIPLVKKIENKYLEVTAWK